MALLTRLKIHCQPHTILNLRVNTVREKKWQGGGCYSSSGVTKSCPKDQQKKNLGLDSYYGIGKCREVNKHIKLVLQLQSKPQWFKL